MFMKDRIDILEKQIDDLTKRLAQVEKVCSYKMELNKKSKGLTIRKILNELALTPGIRGSDYICDLVELGLEDPSIIADRLTNEGYKVVAEKHNKSWHTVEHCVRYAKGYVWLNCDARKLDEMFGYICPFDKDVPTNKAFLKALIRYIKLFLEEEE